jgi:hypothetical protein
VTAGHVLHVFADIATAHYTGLLADAVADHRFYDEAPEWITPETWQAAASVLVEADAVDQLHRQLPPRRVHVVVIAHDLDDASIYTRAVALGAEYVVTLPKGAHIVAGVIGRGLTTHYTSTNRHPTERSA